MVAVAALFGVYILIYGGFIFALVYGFSRVKPYESKDTPVKTTFSIIIPFRTEEQNLHRLLESFAKLDYPRELFELIFVDDASEDFSTNVINKWRIENGMFQTTLLENIRLTGSPKKDAISRAIPIVKSEWIITTDADCVAPKGWLRALDGYISQSGAEMIAGPVTYDGRNSLLHHFQCLDFLSLQGATVGSFGIGKAFMCNGANFAYTKKLFHDIGGFTGNEAIASGDDVFLLQKAVARFREKVHYLKSTAAIISTRPTDSWRSLMNQRVRWAAKTISYQSRFGEDLALVVFMANFFIVATVILAATCTLDWKIAVVLFLAKLLPDWILLAKANTFLNKGRFLFPIFSAVVYPFFSVAVAMYCLFGTYRWKGRTFKV